MKSSTLCAFMGFFAGIMSWWAPEAKQPLLLGVVLALFCTGMICRAIEERPA